MIVVKVKLHSAVTGKVTPLSTVIIDNITDPVVHAAEEGRRGDYRCRSWKRGYELLDIRFGRPALREGFVKGHPRKSKHVLNLVYKALVAMGYAK